MGTENPPSIWKVVAEPLAWMALDADALMDVDWAPVEPLPPFVCSDGTGPAEQQTTLRIVASTTRLCARFDCEDHDIWATMVRRDDPIYDEEVVEVFLAPGTEDPVDYYEFEVSPDGVLFDATIFNPDSDRFTMKGDPSWNCAGISWSARRWDAENRWHVVLTVPWSGLGCGTAPPRNWRANFFRIERPRDAEPEFSCWRPTNVSPADFHKPACFGSLVLPFD